MSDNQNVAPEQGQAIPAPAGVGQASDQAPFFSTKGPDGKETVFKTREDLEKAWKESGMMQSGFTRKTQMLAEFRKQVEQEKGNLAKAQEEMRHKAREYQDFDWLIKNRPDVYKRLQQELSSVPSPDVAVERATKYADEKYGSLQTKVEELESYIQEQELQRQRNTMTEKLRKEYPDFPDDETLNGYLEELGSGDMEKVLRKLYFAHKGQLAPLGAEHRLAETGKQKQEIKILPSSGGTTGKKYVPKTLDEAAEIGLRRITGG